MNDILDLYQELILDHARAPKNFGNLAHKSHHARGHNPLCGDIIDLDVIIEGNSIKDIAFCGDGCAISKASASLMTEKLKGMNLEQALLLFHDFHAMLTEDSDEKDLGKLAVFSGVKQFPARVKCATLCWHTFNAAMHQQPKPITTE